MERQKKLSLQQSIQFAASGLRLPDEPYMERQISTTSCMKHNEGFFRSSRKLLASENFEIKH